MTGFNFAKAALLVTAIGLAAPASQGAPMSPFRAMAGSWTGGGLLSLSNGEQQRLRCRASYDVAGGGDELRLNLRCASDSYNFDLASNAAYRGGAISGEWTETTRNASGTLEGRGAGDRIEVAARGQNFAADLSLTTRGNRQTVSIHPAGTEITAVLLALERR
jgi:hypothetical protein